MVLIVKNDPQHGSISSSGRGETASLPVSSPLVSVCISAYNVERFLPQALGSVLAQSYRHLEIILIDNGSVDRTFEVAQALADERLHCFRVPENLGGYQAMNKVAAMATGEFIAVYHSDDYYEPSIIEKEVAFLQAHPQAGAVFAMDHFMDEEGRIFGGASMPPELRGRELLTYDDVFPFILRNKNILFCCPTFMARRAVFQEVGPFNPESFEIGADLEMWLRILRRYPVGMLDERLMRYRVGRHQWSARYRRLRTERDRHFDVMEHYLEKDGWRSRLSSDDWTEYEFHACDDATFRAKNLLLLGRKAEARKLLGQPYPWRTLAISVKRRKLRLIVLRALLWTALNLGLSPVLSPLLRRIGP